MNTTLDRSDGRASAFETFSPFARVALEPMVTEVEREAGPYLESADPDGEWLDSVVDQEGLESLEVEELEFESEARPTAVTFPSGESLPIVTAAIGPSEEHYDPTNSGTPLLDCSDAHRAKRLSRNFTVDEFARSGAVKFDRARIDPRLVQCIQAIRDAVGSAVMINSAYRSYAYNIQMYAKRGESPTKSQHSSGRAADIRVNGKTGVEIARIAIDVWGGHLGVGVGNGYAHIDVRPNWARWTYFGDTPAATKVIADLDAYRQQRVARGGPEPTTVASPPPILVPSPPVVVPAAAAAASLRQRLVDVARREWERWGRGSRLETDPAMQETLRGYWQNLGLTRAQADGMIRNRDPWSAAFISWVVGQARPAYRFASSAAHRVYVAAAKRGRVAADSSSAYWAYRISEAAPEVGDLVCKARTDASGRCSRVTYDTVDDARELWPLHCDFVTAVRPGQIDVIGGNLGNSVKVKTVHTDGRGFLPAREPGGCQFIAVLKLRETPQTAVQYV